MRKGPLATLASGILAGSMLSGCETTPRYEYTTNALENIAEARFSSEGIKSDLPTTHLPSGDYTFCKFREGAIVTDESGRVVSSARLLPFWGVKYEDTVDLIFPNLRYHEVKPVEDSDISVWELDETVSRLDTNKPFEKKKFDRKSAVEYREIPDFEFPGINFKMEGLTSVPYVGIMSQGRILTDFVVDPAYGLNNRTGLIQLINGEVYREVPGVKISYPSQPIQTEGKEPIDMLEELFIHAEEIRIAPENPN